MRQTTYLVILASACAQMLSLLPGCAEVPIGQEAAALDLDRCSGRDIVCSETSSSAAAAEATIQTCSEVALTNLEPESVPFLANLPLGLEVAPDGTVWSLSLLGGPLGAGSGNDSIVVDSGGVPMGGCGYSVGAMESGPFAARPVDSGPCSVPAMQLQVDHFSAEMELLASSTLPDFSIESPVSPRIDFVLDETENVHLIAQWFSGSTNDSAYLKSTLYAYDQDLRRLRAPLTLLNAANARLVSRGADAVTIAGLASVRQDGHYLPNDGSAVVAGSRSHGVLTHLDHGRPLWSQSMATSTGENVLPEIASTAHVSPNGAGDTAYADHSSQMLIDVFVDGGGLTYVLSQYVSRLTAAVPRSLLILSAFENTGSLRWRRTLKDERLLQLDIPSYSVGEYTPRHKKLFERLEGGVVVHVGGHDADRILSVSPNGGVEWAYQIPNARGVTRDPKSGRYFALTCSTVTTTDPNSTDAIEQCRVTAVASNGTTCKSYAIPYDGIESVLATEQPILFITSSHLYLALFRELQGYRLPTE